METSKLKSDKEKIYDEQISPLMRQIIEVCKEHKIPLFANFGFDPVPHVEDEEGRYPADRCTTSLMGDEYDHHWVHNHFNILLQCCRPNRGVNMDKYLMWVEKEVEKLGYHSSLYLEKLGISCKTGKKKEGSRVV